MSIQALAALICATEALREGAVGSFVDVRTNVREAVNGAEANAKPTAVAFLGDQHLQITGNDWTEGNQTIELVVQIFLPDTVGITLQSPDGPVTNGFDARSIGAEYVFTWFECALKRIFTAEFDNPWAALLKRIAIRHTTAQEFEVRAFEAQAEKGTKIVARDFAVVCETLDAPALGERPVGAWTDFLAQMRASPRVANQADFVEALMTGETILPGWRVMQAILGVTDEGARALGFAPFDPTEAGDPPLLRETTLDQVDEAGATISASTVTQGVPAPFLPPAAAP